MYNTYSTQAWVYMLISIILTIICISLNIYVQGAGLYLLLYILFIKKYANSIQIHNII